MSEIENARRQLQITGYVHPENAVSSKDKRYKTFDTETKEKKDYGTAKTNNGYATFTDKDSEKTQRKIGMTCPECGQVALYECNCEYKDKQCGNGHVWHINQNGQISRGDPHDYVDFNSK